MSNTTKTITHRGRPVTLINRFNKFEDQLCVFPGCSDWGDPGWFVGTMQWYKDSPNRKPSLTTHTFFPGKGSQEKALKSAQTGSYWGYPKV